MARPATRPTMIHEESRYRFPVRDDFHNVRIRVAGIADGF